MALKEFPKYSHSGRQDPPNCKITEIHQMIFNHQNLQPPRFSPPKFSTTKIFSTKIFNHQNLLHQNYSIQGNALWYLALSRPPPKRGILSLMQGHVALDVARGAFRREGCSPRTVLYMTRYGDAVLVLQR